MKHFLAQADNKLVHLPDLKIEIGKRDVIEIPQVGGPPLFAQGRKRPDLCVFTKPNGSVMTGSCQIVEETGKVRSVLVTSTELAANRYIVLGVVEETSDVSENPEAMRIITEAVANLS